MFGSIESQMINSVLTEIFNLKSYPNSLIVNHEFHSAILLSEYYYSQKNYIDNRTLEIIKNAYPDINVTMYSLDSYLKGNHTFHEVYTGSFDDLQVDRVCEEMQCYSFLITIPPSDYIVGLNEEVVIFLSKKNNGIINKIGGISYFTQLFDKQRKDISTPLEVETTEKLNDIFYKNTQCNCSK